MALPLSTATALLDHLIEESVTFHTKDANAPSGNLLAQMGKLRPQGVRQQSLEEERALAWESEDLGLYLSPTAAFPAWVSIFLSLKSVSHLSTM